MKKFTPLQTNTRKGKGFTLIEIIIAVGIFTVIMLLSVGGFLSLSSVQKSVQNNQEILNEFRFAIDLIGREVTSGYSFTDNCENGCGNVKFVSKVRPDVPSGVIHYYLDTNTGRIIKGKQTTYGACYDLIGDPPFYAQCYQPFTSDKVFVDSFKLFIDHDEEWDEKTIITIVIEGRVLPGTKNEKPFQISSSYSPRLAQDPNATTPTDNQPPEIVITNPWHWETFPKEEDSVPIEGTAFDNVVLKKIWWENEESSYTGFALNSTGNISDWIWSILPFRHLHVGENVLNVTAYDKDGNSMSDTVTVTRNDITSLPKPVFHRGYERCSGDKLQIVTSVSGRFDAEKYYLFRCDAGADPNCVPTTQVVLITAQPEERDPWARPKTYEFYTSTNGALWDMVTSGDFPPDGNESAIYFEKRQARYVRLVITAGYSGSLSQIGEFTLVQPNGVPIPKAGWGVVDVNPSCSSGDINDFFDGNPMTCWNSGSGCDPDTGPPHNIDIDLGSMYEFDRFHYVPHQNLRWINLIDTLPAKGTYSYRARLSCTRCNPDIYSPYSDILTIVASLDCLLGGGNGGGGGADFSLTRAPNIIRVGVTGDPNSPSVSESTRVKVNPSGGFSSNITMSVISSGLPSAYLEAHEWPDGTTISSGNYDTGVRYRIVVKGDTPVGATTYPITLQGTGGGKTHTITVYLLVEDAGGGVN